MINITMRVGIQSEGAFHPRPGWTSELIIQSLKDGSASISKYDGIYVVIAGTGVVMAECESISSTAGEATYTFEGAFRKIPI